MFIGDVSESAANTIHAWANAALVVGAILALAGTLGVFWSGGIRDKYADRKLSDNKTETARANEVAGKANERAASLEKDASAAKLELEKLKAKLAWRNLASEQQRAVGEKMARWAKLPVGGAKQSVAVFSITGSFESTRLADQIADALGPSGAGFTINRYPVTYGISLSVSGVAMLTSSNPRGNSVAEALVEALNEQGIIASVAAQKAIGCEETKMWNSIDTDPACSAVSIMVGDHP
jgi:hypothetical protein